MIEIEGIATSELHEGKSYGSILVLALRHMALHVQEIMNLQWLPRQVPRVRGGGQAGEVSFHL